MSGVVNFLCGLCPHCQQGALYRKLSLNTSCTVCGFDIEACDVGDGAIYCSMFVSLILIVTSAMFVDYYYRPSYLVHALIFLPTLLLLTLLLLRYFTIGFIWYHYKHQDQEYKNDL